MSREQFEQALKSKFDDLIDYRICKNGEGEYMVWDTQVAWFAWQAATKQAEAKCAALAAKGMELAAEAAVIYGKYNETQMPDRDLVDMQTIQEMHDLCSGVKNADAFLSEVRAQGVEMVIAYHHERSDALAEVDRNGSFRHHSAAIDATDVLMKIRQEASQ